MPQTVPQNTAGAEKDARIAELERELRKARRELTSAQAQIERYKTSVRSKDLVSQTISAEKTRRNLYLNNLLRVMPEVVLFINPDLEVVMCSESYLAAAGMSSYDEIIGTPAIPDRLEYPDGQNMSSAEQELIDTMNGGVLVEEEIYFTFRPGTEKRYYKKYVLPIQDTDGTPAGVILLFIDVTDISIARENAKKASIAKGTFLANMSHEIRTPMNAIIGMTDIGRGTGDPEKKDYCLDRIHGASIHLLGVINDILDMSKIESGKMTVSREELDFERMLMRVTEVIGYSVEEKEQTLHVDIADNVPQYLVSDGQRLSQVITNLLSNAVKFTPEGGEIFLRVEKTQEIDGACTLRVEVRDTGIGITQEQQANLFQSFQQADSSISRRYGGTGLGLAISKVIVGLLGGEIYVESQPGQGSSFIFTTVASRGRPDDRRLEAAHAGPLRLLVVDATEDVRRGFMRLADRHGFTCHTAADAHTADALARQSAEGYHLAFIGDGTPDMDTLELVRRLKAQGKTQTAVVMTTAAALDALEDDARRAGADHFIAKPLFPSRVVDVINRYCAPPAKAGAAAPAAGHNFTGRRILLAEDIDINQEILITLLEPTGVQVDCADNGSRAVQLFAQNPEQYDLILMDIHMPEKDGYQATREIRALGGEKARSIPIVAMTANVFREDIERCLAAGMNGHIGKPIDLDELLGTLGKHLAG